jgi:Amiloride-sensitive sodium channel
MERLKKSVKSVRSYISDYAKNSSIHGFRYLGQPSRSVFEKFFWIIVILLSLFGCSQIILNIWARYNDSHVMMSIDENPIPYWKIPFPAITICTEGKADHKYFDIANFVSPFSIPTLKGRRLRGNITSIPGDNQ